MELTFRIFPTKTALNSKIRGNPKPWTNIVGFSYDEGEQLFCLPPPSSIYVIFRLKKV